MAVVAAQVVREHRESVRQSGARLAAVLWAVLLGLLAASSAFGQAAALDLQGRQADPWQASQGKTVVLVFIRTDCPVSSRYAPTIQKLSAQYADKARFFLVYPDKDESAASIQKYLRDYGYHVPALRDPQHVLVKLSQATVTPEVAVFTSDKHLTYHGRIDNWYESFGHARSAPTTHELDDALQATLAGRHPDPAVTASVGCYISDLER